MTLRDLVNPWNDMRAVILATALITGCAITPPRVVQTPPVCPAPRALPTETLAAIAALPARLPELPASAASTDAAAALFANGAQSASMYQACRRAADGAADWIKAQ